MAVTLTDISVSNVIANILLKVSTLMHNFTLFYYKELLQKMQISVSEKYIPLHGLQANIAIKAPWSFKVHLHTPSTAPVG